MTDQNVQVHTTPLVQVVTGEDEDRVFAFSDIALPGDDPATISDAELKARIARYLDRDVHSFDNLIVTRPSTGNVLLAPKPVYGDENAQSCCEDNVKAFSFEAVDKDKRDYREVSLSLAINYCKENKSEDVLQVAKMFYRFLIEED